MECTPASVHILTGSNIMSISRTPLHCSCLLPSPIRQSSPPRIRPCIRPHILAFNPPHTRHLFRRLSSKYRPRSLRRSLRHFPRRIPPMVCPSQLQTTPSLCRSVCECLHLHVCCVYAAPVPFSVNIPKQHRLPCVVNYKHYKNKNTAVGDGIQSPSREYPLVGGPPAVLPASPL